jgi:quercetin dioxygenase-like cupin family protein
MTQGATAITTTDRYEWGPFPIPGARGDIRAAFLNRDLGAGPIVAAMQMAPGARIPAHVHRKATETFLVLEGNFVNAGTDYGPGAFFSVRPGDIHGPHETRDGCTIVFMQSVEVDPSDFEVSE